MPATACAVCGNDECELTALPNAEGVLEWWCINCLNALHDSLRRAVMMATYESAVAEVKRDRAPRMGKDDVIRELIEAGRVAQAALGGTVLPHKACAQLQEAIIHGMRVLEETT